MQVCKILSKNLHYLLVFYLSRIIYKLYIYIYFKETYLFSIKAKEVIRFNRVLINIKKKRKLTRTFETNR